MTSARAWSALSVQQSWDSKLTTTTNGVIIEAMTTTMTAADLQVLAFLGFTLVVLGILLFSFWWAWR